MGFRGGTPPLRIVLGRAATKRAWFRFSGISCLGGIFVCAALAYLSWVVLCIWSQSCLGAASLSREAMKEASMDGLRVETRPGRGSGDITRGTSHQLGPENGSRYKRLGSSMRNDADALGTTSRQARDNVGSLSRDIGKHLGDDVIELLGHKAEAESAIPHNSAKSFTSTNTDALGRSEKHERLLSICANVRLKPSLVITCSRERRGSMISLHTAHGFVLKSIMQAEIVQQSHPWEIWSSCGTAAQDRMKPTESLASPRHSMVLNLPGSTPFAAKAGLWNGFRNILGQEAERIAPKTFLNVNGDPLVREELSQYVRDYPEAIFVVKSGKHRQRGVSRPTKNITELLEGSIVQRIVEGIRHPRNNARTAFRTYVWIRCVENGRAEAVIDWRSPGYVAETANDLIASGYSKNTHGLNTNAWDLLNELFPTRDKLEALVLNVESKVSQFLKIFQDATCTGLSNEFYSRTMVTELFGFDWIPLVDENETPDVRLLESNRFPDTFLSAPSAPVDKDMLKICSVLRRFTREVLEPRFEACFTDARESFVQAAP